MEDFNSTKSSYQQICHGFLENGISKSLSVTYSLLLSCIALPLLYGIIWYERFGSDLKRTLINQLFSSVCWYLITSIIVVQLPLTVRFMIQNSLSCLYCTTVEFIAATLFNLILGLNYSNKITFSILHFKKFLVLG